MPEEGSGKSTIRGRSLDCEYLISRLIFDIEVNI